MKEWYDEMVAKHGKKVVWFAIGVAAVFLLAALF